MEHQLQHLIKSITGSPKATTQVIRESNHEELGVVRDRLDSIFDVVSKEDFYETYDARHPVDQH